MRGREIELGELIGDEYSYERDAVHVAVIPVVAGEKLSPGQKISPVERGSSVVKAHVSDVEAMRKGFDDPVGIVDPFLDSDVEEGQKFWMLIRPGTTTPVRHDWSHPAFVDKERYNQAKHWMEAFAQKIGVDYDYLLWLGERFADGEHVIMEDGKEVDRGGEKLRDIWMDVYKEFFDHLEVLTGKVPASGTAGIPSMTGGFTCYC